MLTAEMVAMELGRLWGAIRWRRNRRRRPRTPETRAVPQEVHTG